MNDARSKSLFGFALRALIAGGLGYFAGFEFSRRYLEVSAIPAGTNEQARPKKGVVLTPDTADRPFPSEQEALVKFLASSRSNVREFKVQLRDLERSDPVAAWAWLFAIRSKVSAKDWLWLKQQVTNAMRPQADPAYLGMVAGWEDPQGTVSYGYISDMGKTGNTDTTWNAALDKATNKSELLRYLAQYNGRKDWQATVDLLQTQAIDDSEKGPLLDIAVSRWAAKEGFDKSAAWMLDESKSGTVWDVPRMGLAIDAFQKNPQLAATLLSQIESPALRNSAVLAIASQNLENKALISLRPMVPNTVWTLIPDSSGNKP